MDITTIHSIIFIMHTNQKNKRTYEKNAFQKNAFQVETAEDLETLVSDKRLGWRASPSKARRRQRRYKNRIINEIYKIERN